MAWIGLGMAEKMKFATVYKHFDFDYSKADNLLQGEKVLDFERFPLQHYESSALMYEHAMDCYGLASIYSWCRKLGLEKEMVEKVGEKLKCKNFGERKRQLLKQSREYILNASQLESCEEPALAEYFLGKISEKLEPEKPEVYLHHYLLALIAVEEIDKAAYPSALSSSNWSKTKGAALLAIEVFYRFHAAIIKYLTRLRLGSENLRHVKIFNAYLDLVQDTGFIKNKGQAKRNQKAITGDDVKPLWLEIYDDTKTKVASKLDEFSKLEINDPAETELTLVKRCIEHGIFEILSRNQWWYKAFTRLADVYTNYEPLKSADDVVNLMMMKPRGLPNVSGMFHGRKPNNFFADVWQVGAGSLNLIDFPAFLGPFRDYH